MQSESILAEGGLDLRDGRERPFCVAGSCESYMDPDTEQSNDPANNFVCTFGHTATWNAELNDWEYPYE